MKKHLFIAGVLLPAAFAFSQQNAYEKCVAECILAGGDSVGCMTEGCNINDTAIHIVPNHGSPLLLPSYEMKGPAPVIDGSIMSRDGDPGTSDAKDEWKEACSRTLILNDSTQVQLFLMNTPETLYVGMTYQDVDNSNGCGVRLLFDQGDNAPPSQYHGSTDLRLTAPGGICNENGCGLYKSGSSYDMHDLCWNGKSWIDDGDGKIDFRGASHFFNTDNKIHHNEFAIPLVTNKANDAANSDLNVHYDDVIGFYLEVVRMGAHAGTFYWRETNGLPNRPDSFPNWARIQLSVKREFFTFYTGRAPTPPVIDGSLTDAVWNGAYQRELILSNFHYGYYRGKIWCLEDSAQNSIFIGLRVFDKIHNPGDYCQIYLEEDGTNTTNATRNYVLDNNAESGLRAANGKQFSDYFWDMNAGAWTVNTSADSQAGKTAEDALYTDYEFKIQRAGGAYHIDIPRGGLLGFLIRFHDADKTVQDLSNFYWEYTTNNDAQLLDQQSHPYVYIATGWTNLQLGGPYLEVVKPSTADEISGTVQVQVSSGSDSLKSVLCFLASDTTTKIDLVYQGSGVWAGTITVPSTATGSQMLVVRAVTPSNLVVERIVNQAEPPNAVKSPAQKSAGPFGIGQTVQSPRRNLQFLVTMKQPGGLTLEVYSVAGKVLWSSRIPHLAPGQHWIDMGNCYRRLANGTYMVQLTGYGEKVMRKFTVFK